MLQAHVYKIENQCGRIETLSRMSSGVLAAQGFLIPLDLVQTQAGQPNDLLLLNIIGSILDSDSRRIGPNPVGATNFNGVDLSVIQRKKPFGIARSIGIWKRIYSRNRRR